MIPGSGRSFGEGNVNLLQYSCLENPTDRRAWLATVRGVTKSQTELSNSHSATALMAANELSFPLSVSTSVSPLSLSLPLTLWFGSVLLSLLEVAL